MQVLQHVVADDGVALQDVELLLRQLAGLTEDGVGNVDLADVVEQPALLEPLPSAVVAGRVLHLPGDRQRVLGDPARVAGGVAVLGVHQLRHRLQRLEDDQLALSEEPRVVDRHRGLGAELGRHPLVVLAERLPLDVVGEEEDADGLGSQHQRHAQDRPRIEGAGRGAGLVGVVHEGLAGGDHLLADLATEVEGEPPPGLDVGAVGGPDDELALLLEGEHPDLGLRRLGDRGQDLVQHLVDLEGGGDRGQPVHQVAELPDHPLAGVEELGVVERDHDLVGEGGQDPGVVLAPLVLIGAENGEGPPERVLALDGHAERPVEPRAGEVGRRGHVEGVGDVGDGQRLPAERHRTHHALAVADLGPDQARREAEDGDDAVAPLPRGLGQHRMGAAAEPCRDLQRLLLQRRGALGGGCKGLGDLAQGVEGRGDLDRLPGDLLQDPRVLHRDPGDGPQLLEGGDVLVAETHATGAAEAESPEDAVAARDRRQGLGHLGGLGAGVDAAEEPVGPTQAERLVASVLHGEGYEAIDPQSPLGGPDGLKDVLFDFNGWK